MPTRFNINSLLLVTPSNFTPRNIMSEQREETGSLTSDPLHGGDLLKCISRKKFNTAVLLLANGACPDVIDAKSGDYAIHAAIRSHNAPFVKLLIVFWADLSVKTRDGQTPMELARSEGKKADECAEAIGKVLALQELLKNTAPRGRPSKPTPKANDEDVYLLTMDGGGIRGLVFIQSLLGMERRRKQLYPDSECILNYFNWFGGTSTGAIAALAFNGCGKTLEDGRLLYLKLKDDVLGSRHFPYANDTVNRVFQDVFGTTLTMSSITERNVAVMTTIGSTAPPNLHIMSNYGDARDGQAGPRERLLWEAARATSAAVPFFQPFNAFLDGGFIANNPTVDTIVDMMKHREKTNVRLKLKVVLSLGCGNIDPTPVDLSHFHRSVTESVFGADRPRLHLSDKVIGINAALGWAMTKNASVSKDLLELMIRQLTQTCAIVSERGEYLAKSLGAHFFRVDPKTEFIEFTESDDEKIVNVMYSAMIGALEATPTIDKVIDAVVGGIVDDSLLH